MATSVKVTPEELGIRIKASVKNAQKSLQGALMVGGERAVAFLKEISPVDRGPFKNAWRRVRAGKGAQVTNDAPYAGIIERGARPHKVSAEGREAITAWVQRVLRIDDVTEAEKIMRAICHKLETEGQKGKFLVANNLDKLTDMAVEEVAKALARANAGGK